MTYVCLTASHFNHGLGKGLANMGDWSLAWAYFPLKTVAWTSPGRSILRSFELQLSSTPSFRDYGKHYTHDWVGLC